MKRFFILFITLAAGSLYAQTDVPHIHYLADPGAAERNHSTDITHMKVEVGFEPEKGVVHGTVTHDLVTLQNNIDTLFFDAPGIQIHSAEMDGKPVPFTTNPEGVVLRFPKKLHWDETHTVVFKYTATPKRGIYFIGWNQPENTGKPDINYIRKQIWTQGQGIDNRHWIPMYDNMNDKFTTETVVKVKNPYKCLSNGRKISVKDNGDGTSTWHYMLEKPHAGYLLMLGIGNYEIKETKTKYGTPVQFWYYPEFKDRVELTSLHTERMIELLEEETGIPYPWGSYAQIMVQNFLYGAMENTSATVFGDFFTVDAMGFKDRNYMGVNCHELTHQWFGDLITARGGGDTWLQESFATFYPKLFFRELEGEDAYQWAVRGEYNAALAQGEKDNFPVRHTRGGTVRVYPKGSAVLSMLRYQLGEAEFKRFINAYLHTYGFRNVETWDLQKTLKDVLGLNYDWFFDQWVHRGGEPHFKVSYKAAEDGIRFKIKQTHQTDGHVRYFKMPVRFAVYYKNGSVDRHTRWVSDSVFQEIILPNTGGEVEFVLFDEENRMMKKVDFIKPKEELMAQAVKATYMIDRYDAIAAMKDLPYNDKVAFLQARFAAEKHHGIRAEIARQLANRKELNKWYGNIVRDQKAEVKIAFIAADSLVAAHKSIFMQLLKDSSNNVVENALDKLMKEKSLSSKDRTAALKATENRHGQNNNIRSKWLEYAIQYGYGDKKSNELELVKLAGPLYEFRTRVAAAQSMKRLNRCSAELASNLIDACLSYNGRLAGPCAEVIKELSKTDSHKSAFDTIIAGLSDEQKERLKKLGI